MSSKTNFYDMVSTAGAKVTITRPATSASGTVYMAGTGTTREYSLTGDETQEGEDSVMSVLDFANTGLTAPQKGDRITDIDDSVFAVSYVKKMFGVSEGVGRTLLGWRLRIIG